MKLITLLIFAMFLFSCSTTPTPINKAKNISTDRIFEIEPLSNEEKFATLKILRDSGANGGNQFIELWINGELSAKLLPEELHSQKLDPKEHILEVRMHNVLGKISPAQVETIFREGRIYFYRVGFNANSGSLVLTRDVSLSQ